MLPVYYKFRVDRTVVAGKKNMRRAINAGVEVIAPVQSNVNDCCYNQSRHHAGINQASIWGVTSDVKTSHHIGSCPSAFAVSGESPPCPPPPNVPIPLCQIFFKGRIYLKRVVRTRD